MKYEGWNVFRPIEKQIQIKGHDKFWLVNKNKFKAIKNNTYFLQINNSSTNGRILIADKIYYSTVYKQ